MVLHPPILANTGGEVLMMRGGQVVVQLVGPPMLYAIFASDLVQSRSKRSINGLAVLSVKYILFY